jgi:pimeloyl-ACP methyl ester carboxylesterase
MPVFMAASLRMYREIAAARPGLLPSIREAARHGWNVLTHMFSPSRMARRVELLKSLDLRHELTQVTVPALLITGEASLDRVVPVSATHEYLRLWPQATVATIARTGHLGLITRPSAFANVVVPFAEQAARVSSNNDPRPHLGRRVG